MATLTAKYMVTREGWAGKVTMPDGSTGWLNGLYCEADKRILQRKLEKLVQDGTIVAWEIEWTIVRVQAG